MKAGPDLARVDPQGGNQCTFPPAGSGHLLQEKKMTDNPGIEMTGERRGCWYKVDDGHRVLFWVCLN